MSATLVGAVLKIGPEDRTKRFVMVAIADNADDYGFACPSVETIADMTVCDARTVKRVLHALEEEAWIRIGRRMLNRGKSNVYFLNVEKLEVAPGPKSRKSPLHADLERMMEKKALADPKPVVTAAPVEDLQPDAELDLSGGVVSPEIVEEVENEQKSGDIPQGCQVTNSTLSGDISCIPILKNRCEPLLNPNKGNTPQPPLRGGGVDFKSNGNGGEPDRKPKAAGEPCKAAPGGPWDADATEQRVRTECETAMLECGLSNPRLLRVIADAMRMQTKRERMSPIEVRLMMVASWKRWKADAEYMRHSIGPRKFFGEGYWLDETLWPLDHARIERERHRAKASIGTRW